jgi:hypothetical protein
MTRAPGELASWGFAAEGMAGAELVSGMLAVLGRHGLLRARRLEGWGAGGRVVPLGGGDEESVAAALEEVARPAVTFRGDGLVYDGEGAAVVMPDPVTVTLFTEGGVSAEVATDLDVWLSYDVHAVAQHAVAERNRPRLRAALEEIAGFAALVRDSGTRYASVDGFRVRNHTNVFGEPIAVVS